MAVPKGHVYTGLRRYAESQGSLDASEAQKVVGYIFKALGVQMVPGSAACRDVTQRTIDALVTTGALVRGGRNSYLPAAASASTIAAAIN